MSVEKEFAQATTRSQTTGLTDHQALHHVLSQAEHRYLIRQLCWIFTVEGLETFILQPRYSGDIDMLVGSLRPQPSPLDVDIVIGSWGPLAPPDLCNGLTLPVVLFDQVYSFDRDTLAQALPRPDNIPAKAFAATIQEVLGRVLQMSQNTGISDDERSLNYLVTRYPAIYAAVAEAHSRDFALTHVQAWPSRLSGARKVEEVVFTFTNRGTDVVEKLFVRVDVTEEFPFLITKLAPYFDR